MYEGFDPNNIRSLFDLILKLVPGTIWHSRMQSVTEEHFKAASRHLNIDTTQYMVDRQNRLGDLIYFVFGDFCSRYYGENGDSNFVTDFVQNIFELKTDPGLNFQFGFLEVVRDTRFSIYEVVDVVDGESLTLRDLIYGGDKIVTQYADRPDTMEIWHCVAGKLIFYDNAKFLSPFYLPFDQQMAGMFLEEIEQRVAQIQKQDNSSVSTSRDEILAGLPTAVLLSEVWNAALDKRGGRRIGLHPPTFGTVDGEILEFHEATFRVIGNPKKIRRKFNTLPFCIKHGSNEWHVAIPKQSVHDFIKSASSDSSFKLAEQNTKDEDKEWIGFVQLHSRTLRFWANSEERSAAGIKMIKPILGRLVSGPLVTSMNLEDSVTMASKSSKSDRSDKRNTPIPKEIFDAFGNLYEEYYMLALDLPVRDYDGKTPREMAISRHDRRKALEWLKMRELADRRLVREKGGQLYDFDWMWRELGFDRSRD